MKAIAELTDAEKDQLHKLPSTTGWSVYMGIVESVMHSCERDIVELERQVFEKGTPFRIGVLRRYIDLCKMLINIPVPEEVSELIEDIKEELDGFD